MEFIGTRQKSRFWWVKVGQVHAHRATGFKSVTRFCGCHPEAHARLDRMQDLLLQAGYICRAPPWHSRLLNIGALIITYTILGGSLL